mgnify:CR=1 FL=1
MPDCARYDIGMRMARLLSCVLAVLASQRAPRAARRPNAEPFRTARPAPSRARRSRFRRFGAGHRTATAPVDGYASSAPRLSFRGAPYRQRRQPIPNGFDCSGFTQACVRAVRRARSPREVREQFARAFPSIARVILAPGDLLFFCDHRPWRVARRSSWWAATSSSTRPSSTGVVRVESRCFYWRRAVHRRAPGRA